MRLVLVVVGVLLLGAVVRVVTSDRDDRFPPDHIGLVELSVVAPPEGCGEVSERWGCEERGERVIFGFYQAGKLVAQHPTYAGATFRLELPEGEYHVRIVEPRGTYASVRRLTVGGGAKQRSDILWPVDKTAADRLSEEELE